MLAKTGAKAGREGDRGGNTEAHSSSIQGASKSRGEGAAGQEQGQGQGQGPPGGTSLEEWAVQRSIPMSNQIDMLGHTKAVSCISVEPSGSRVVTGSLDSTLKMFDFGGMDSRHRAFKSVEAQEAHMVAALAHSPSGDRFIVATGSNQPKIFDREGVELLKFVRGDMYLRDLSNTKGHTMEVMGVAWHPFEKEIVLTCSTDGSLRLWDLTGECAFGNLINRHVLKVRPATGANRLAVHSCCFSPSGAKIVGGCADGSVQIWGEKKIYSRADMVLRNAACVGVVSSVLMAQDTLAVRCDGVLLLWNTKSASAAKLPLKVIPGVPNDYPTANAAFSPDGTLLCAGTSPTAPSRLQFFDVSGPSTTPCLSLALEPCAAIYVLWQPASNQILVGLASGAVRVLYDPRCSKKGALLSAHKTPKRVRDPSDYAPTEIGEIFNPLALPMYRTDMPGESKKKAKADLKDPYLCKIPGNKLDQGPGNRPNNNFFFTNYMTDGLKVKEMRDVREELLEINAVAAADPKYTGAAYATSQPKKEMHGLTFEAEQEEFKKRMKKMP
ncbi:WD40-repeat-containing domain protein [Ochromonadaceae sp. CCMP2298]|nr:WD40-repeat-containing domain protein [Ochromonadaceae sp. CCMP2298]